MFFGTIGLIFRNRGAMASECPIRTSNISDNVLSKIASRENYKLDSRELSKFSTNNPMVYPLRNRLVKASGISNMPHSITLHAEHLTATKNKRPHLFSMARLCFFVGTALLTYLFGLCNRLHLGFIKQLNLIAKRRWFGIHPVLLQPLGATAIRPHKLHILKTQQRVIFPFYYKR